LRGIALALGFAGTMIYLIPAARSLLARRRAGLAFKRLEKSLDYLVEGAESADPSPFFAALSRALRLYLTVRVLPEASTLTAAELASLPETAFPASATRGRAAALIARADRVRYGGEVLISRKDLAIFQSSVEEARAIGAENEEALLARL